LHIAFAVKIGRKIHNEQPDADYAEKPERKLEKSFIKIPHYKEMIPNILKKEMKYLPHFVL